VRRAASPRGQRQKREVHDHDAPCCADIAQIVAAQRARFQTVNKIKTPAEGREAVAMLQEDLCAPQASYQAVRQARIKASRRQRGTAQREARVRGAEIGSRKGVRWRWRYRA